MPRTLAEGFRDFLLTLTPSQAESGAAARHRASIEDCLKRNFNLQRFFRTGSFGNGTSIYGFSDTDYFASIPANMLNQDSGVTLSRVRDALHTRFPTTGVRVNCPAIRAPLGTVAAATTEIVPADYVFDTEDGFKVYEIPDCRGGWMYSSPDAHNSYVRVVDRDLGRRVKPLIRFIKAWKYYRNVPISSFYLELQVATYAEGESYIDYDIDVYRVLLRLAESSLAPLEDPMGVSGYIQPCKTELQLNTARSKLSRALGRVQKAFEAKEAGDIRLTFEWWRQLYDNYFPTYYY